MRGTRALRRPGSPLAPSAPLPAPLSSGSLSWGGLFSDEDLEAAKVDTEGVLSEAPHCQREPGAPKEHWARCSVLAVQSELGHGSSVCCL